MAKVRKVMVDIACNDGDNGMFVGHAPMIALPDSSLELTASGWDYRIDASPRFRMIPGAIVLSGKHWPIFGSVEWHGNWCWNSYAMDPDVARRFLIWLHAKRSYNCEGGWCSIANLWDLDEPLDHDAVGLDRYLKEITR